MIKVGITGQSGFIGTHLTNYLTYIKKSYSIIPFDDNFFDEIEKLNDFVSKCDVIVHLAGVNRHYDAEYIYSKNIELTEKLIDSINSVGNKPHIIFSSSIQEDRNNVYGKAKKKAREKLIEFSQSNGNKFTGLIIPNVFGPFGKPFYNSVIATFSHQLTNNEQPKIEVDATLNLIYVQELVSIIETTIENQISQMVEKERVQHSTSIRVSEILNILLNFKNLYYEQGIIPEIKNSFELNLFNTFRSYIDYESYYPRKYKVNTDERGAFVELTKSNIGGQVSFSTSNPAVIRGNHFHTRKIERFSVIKGEAKIQLRRIGTNKVLEFTLNGDDPSFIDMPIWYTHNLINIGDKELITIFWINEFFDPDDPDTFFERV